MISILEYHAELDREVELARNAGSLIREAIEAGASGGIGTLEEACQDQKTRYNIVEVGDYLIEIIYKVRKKGPDE